MKVGLETAEACYHLAQQQVTFWPNKDPLTPSHKPALAVEEQFGFRAPEL